MWFQKLVGFREQNPQQVRENLRIEGHRLISLVNDRAMCWGKLETPSLADLREQVSAIANPKSGAPTIREVVADVQSLHVQSDNAGALFQVASQFNLLEMVSPAVTPEEGIGIYEYDFTQGPACAIACGAGTIYRNYFVPLGDQLGQTSQRQIDCLTDLGIALGNTDDHLWDMKNGYALPSKAGLLEIAQIIDAADFAERDRLRGFLRIGIQWGTEVTIGDQPHCVTQAYCSALPVTGIADSKCWQPLASLILEASYEACLLSAVINAHRSGNRKVFLTLIGGGAFNNDMSWIVSAISRAVEKVDRYDLEIAIVSYGSPTSEIRELLTN